MGVIEKRLDSLRREKGKERERALLEKCYHVLEEEKPLRGESFLPEEQMVLAGFAFLSKMPLLVVYNVDEVHIQTPLPSELSTYAEENGLTILPICGNVEMEIAQLEEGEREMFLAALGLQDWADGSPRLDDHAWDGCREGSQQDSFRYRARLYPG